MSHEWLLDMQTLFEVLLVLAIGWCGVELFRYFFGIEDEQRHRYDRKESE